MQGVFSDRACITPGRYVQYCAANEGWPKWMTQVAQNHNEDSIPDSHLCHNLAPQERYWILFNHHLGYRDEYEWNTHDINMRGA